MDSKGKFHYTALESIGECSSPSSRPWARRRTTTNICDVSGCSQMDNMKMTRMRKRTNFQNVGTLSLWDAVGPNILNTPRAAPAAVEW